MRKIACIAFCIITLLLLALPSLGADITAETSFYATFRPYPFSTSVSMQNLPSSGQLLSGATGANALGIAVRLPADTVLTNGTTLYYTYRVSLVGANPVQFTSQGLYDGVDYGNFSSSTFTKSGQIPEEKILRNFTYTSSSRDGAIVTVAIPVVDGYLSYMDIMHTTTQNGMIYVTVYDPLVTYGGASEEILNRMNDIVVQLQAQGASIDETNRKLDALQQSVDNQSENEYNEAMEKADGRFDVDIGITSGSFDSLPPLSFASMLADVVASTTESSVFILPECEVMGIRLWGRTEIDFSDYENIEAIAFLHTCLKWLMWLCCGVYVAKVVMDTISLITGEKAYQDAVRDIFDSVGDDVTEVTHSLNRDDYGYGGRR